MLTAVLGVCIFYALAWTWVGRDPKPGTIITRYSPPRDLSPAMLRYVWKETFDDRTFWAAVLSLVSKGVAIMKSEDNRAVIRPAPKGNVEPELPEEERLLFKMLLDHHTRKGVAITMLDGRTTLAASKMADSLRKAAVGKWFRENREYVIAGSLLSVVAICVTAAPHQVDELLALGASLTLMALGAFYLVFLVLRICDLLRAARKRFDRAVISRAALFFVFVVPCIAAIVLGSVVLGGAFGWSLVVVTALMAILDLSFLRLMRAPTADGRKLLDEIEGFRLFLKSVERLPLDRTEAPSDHAESYEKYLPYALALEVEQSWGDRFVALVSTCHQPEGSPHTESIYLGMWDGKPLEIIYQPGSTRSGRPY